jgi:DNA-binding CsgD family transcriptional regulator
MTNSSILTLREMEILSLLFAGRSKPFNAEEICISEKILAFYLDYVRTKLNTEARPVERAWTPSLQSETETREIAELRRL